jgi:hypothetical protein
MLSGIFGLAALGAAGFEYLGVVGLEAGWGRRIAAALGGMEGVDGGRRAARRRRNDARRGGMRRSVGSYRRGEGKQQSASGQPGGGKARKVGQDGHPSVGTSRAFDQARFLRKCNPGARFPFRPIGSD